MIYMFLVIVFGLVILIVWRQFDRRADRAEMERLIALQPTKPDTFSSAMVADLPEPARRYFSFSIAEGTPLYTVALLEMAGQFGMGDKARPNYQPMRATQVLAAPEGFIWEMSGGTGALRMSGSDGRTWTRFWLFSLVPVARAGGTPDHIRSAFGRYASEAIFWTPAAVLPGPNVTWQPVAEDVARMTMRFGALEQSVDVTVDKDGRPRHVSFMRWSNANPDKVHRLQPFGGYLSEFREFEGFRLPTHIEAGNMFETEDYFPFFIADVSDIRFPHPQS
jgi:hypothetical protein